MSGPYYHVGAFRSKGTATSSSPSVLLWSTRGFLYSIELSVLYAVQPLSMPFSNLRRRRCGRNSREFVLPKRTVAARQSCVQLASCSDLLDARGSPACRALERLRCCSTRLLASLIQGGPGARSWSTSLTRATGTSVDHSWGQPRTSTLKTTAARGASHFESVVRDTPRAVVRWRGEAR